jgi:outer membrane lipoprotein-sorting protein
MRTAVSLIILLFISQLNVSGQAQKADQAGQEAIKILDRFSKTSLDAPSVSMKFKLVTENQAEKSTETSEGSIILSKDKYKLELPNNTIWYNGSESWSYLIAEKEVTVTKADKKDNSFLNKPSSVFTMYKSGYKCRLIEELTDSYIIDLYPVDIKSDILRVRILIGKTRMNLITLEYKRRDGLIVTLNITDYNLAVKPDAETFVFRADKYKGVDVIDMR